jgi:hypothetical protein
VADAGHPAPKQVTAKTKKTSPLIGQPADTLQQLSTTEPVKPDTPLLVKAPVPKKLRVIHINELEGPPDPAGVATVVPRRYVMPTFRFVLAHTETSGTVSYEKPSTNTPLKIKISKQN